MIKKEKNRCQIFTPQKYARKLLNVVGYKENLYGKSLLENSCGDGSILKEVVERYIADCQKNGRLIDEIKCGLEKDIVAFEIDQEKLEECIINLNKICKKYKIEDVNWNIKNCDSLKYTYEQKFDYIVGNPPYISYRDLTEDNRKYVKENFKSCHKGKFDYCYAFIESAFNNLNETGKMSYLIPNSIFKNVFAADLRRQLKDNKICAIYDNFPGKVFKNATVSPSILVIDKNKNTNIVEYYDQIKKRSVSIPYDKLTDKWIFNLKESELDERKIIFGKYFDIGNSIATLRNDIFLIKDYKDVDENHIKNGSYLIEKSILKKAASPSSLKGKKNYLIIFPYKFENENVVKYEENEFKEEFPNAYKYLKSFKKELQKRNSDSNANWFEYGRSQALKNMNKRKIMISIMLTNKINVYLLDKETIPYSGIYIVQNKEDINLEVAKKILNSKKFYKQLEEIGIKSEGQTRRITCNDVKNIKILEEEIWQK